MRAFKCAIAIFAMAPTVGAAECAKVSSFQYVRIDATREDSPIRDSFSIDTRKSLLWRSDDGEALQFCAKNSAYICFSGYSLSFAVPQGALTLDREWEVEGKKYRVKSVRTIEVLGFKSDTFVIESQKGSGQIQYFYSRAHGVIAMQFREGSDNEAILVASRTACGFGAAE